jgi:hypothetical protein
MKTDGPGDSGPWNIGPWKILRPGGKQIVIRPGTNDFDKFCRQFPHVLSRLVPQSVVVIALLPGWALSKKIENCWIELVSVIPANKLELVESVKNEQDWNVVKSKAEEIADYILRTRVFLGVDRADMNNLRGISDDNPNQPFMEDESLNVYPYLCKSIKGLENVKFSKWADVAKILAHAEGLLSRRKIGTGRPATFKNKEEFLAALEHAVGQVGGHSLTQPNIADLIGADERQIRLWCEKFEVDWSVWKREQKAKPDKTG